MLLKMTEQNLIQYKSDASQDEAPDNADYYEDLIMAIKSPIEIDRIKDTERAKRIKSATKSLYALGSVNRILQGYIGKEVDHVD
jgi:hypothetical protein